MASGRGRSASAQSSRTGASEGQGGAGRSQGWKVIQARNPAIRTTPPYKAGPTTTASGRGPSRTLETCAAATQSPTVPSTSQALSTRITPAASHDSASAQAGVTNSPMLRRSDVKWIKGITAKESCKLSTTWLRTSNGCMPASPTSRIVTTAGASATSLVKSAAARARAAAADALP